MLLPYVSYKGMWLLQGYALTSIRPAMGSSLHRQMPLMPLTVVLEYRKGCLKAKRTKATYRLAQLSAASAVSSLKETAGLTLVIKNP